MTEALITDLTARTLRTAWPWGGAGMRNLPT